ncbi:Hypothetical protein LUCI_1538 [Lucifera butyrica]|uniref:3D domain-containing protein n=1 Tax=Lucifera butyrica TaxID=1351585 RepID=A0A498RB15_9FIRM|nr:peptidoglycan-binding protein [Lucifera butyrica]VBB06308.1 Hypothetical protein LUCI_1538 [Lucifera butyrica]
MKKVFLLAACIFLLSMSATVYAAAADKPVQFGMRGDEVKTIQKLLADSGFFAGEIDGVFGNLTLRAVQRFQQENGLPPDGTVGKATLAYLERTAQTQPSRYSRALTMTASAYTAQDAGTGAFTYGGHPLRKGLIAVDPSVIPLGTRLYIPGYGYGIADDIGSSITGARIDLAFENRGEALQFGVQRVTVYVLD